MSDKITVYCPMCGKAYSDLLKRCFGGKTEGVIVCKCGYTSFVEIYYQSAFMES